MWARCIVLAADLDPAIKEFVHSVIGSGSIGTGR